jgi:hypothetical protein
VLFKNLVPSTTDEGFVQDEFFVVECQGCNEISFLHIERQYTKRWKLNSVFHHNYPEMDFGSLQDYDFLSDEEIQELPKTIARLYSEITDAFECDSSILSGIGLRTLVEAICLDQKINGGNLEKKIKGLHDKGLISGSELPILDKLRLIGNVSAHDIKSLSMRKLNYALSIVNHVIKSIYILPRLDKGIKLRPKKRKP